MPERILDTSIDMQYSSLHEIEGIVCSLLEKQPQLSSAQLAVILNLPCYKICQALAKLLKSKNIVRATSKFIAYYRLNPKAPADSLKILHSGRRQKLL